MTQEITKMSMKRLINYFLKGLLFVLPIAVSGYVIYRALTLIDSIIPLEIPGLGFLVIITSVTLIGYLGSKVFAQPLLELVDDWLERTPGVKFIYSSIKDVMEAFVGDKKKFTEAVMLEVHEGVYRLGFVTQYDLSNLHADELQQMVSVYCPSSYGMMGDLFVVRRDKIKEIKSNSTELMKFIVSGGVTNMEKKHHEHEHKEG